MTAPAATTDPATPSSRLPLIAMIAAGAALVIVTVTVAIVMTRGDDAPAAAAAVPAGPTVDDGTVPAAAVEALAAAEVTEATAPRTGVVLKDGYAAAGILPGDAVLAINGRPTRLAVDVRRAVKRMAAGDQSWLYVELERQGRSVLVRRRIDGNISVGGVRDQLGLPDLTANTLDSTVTGSGGGSADPAVQAALDAITAIDDTHFRVARKGIDAMLANPMAIAKGARIVPAVKNGRPDGFKIYAIRPNSVYRALGLENGDTVVSVNGFELTSPDKALDIYARLRDATSLEVEIVRRGRPRTHHYEIVD